MNSEGREGQGDWVCVSYVGDILFDVFFELSATGPISSEDDFALEGNDDLRLGGGAEVWQIEGFNFLLVDHDDINSLFELINDTNLQVPVEGHEGLAVTTPRRMHVHYQQLRVLLVEVGEEVSHIHYHRRQLYLLRLLVHTQLYQFKQPIYTSTIIKQPYHLYPLSEFFQSYNLYLLGLRTGMDDIQQEYRERVAFIRHMRVQTRVKILLMEGLINEMRQLDDLARNSETRGKTNNYQILSTTVSECHSTSYQAEKEIEDLEEKIIQMQKVKFEKNEQIESLEEQLDCLQQAVRAQSEYNDHLKRKMVLKMQSIQGQNRPQRQQKSVLNKSFDAVAGILTFRWW